MMLFLTQHFLEEAGVLFWYCRFGLKYLYIEIARLKNVIKIIQGIGFDKKFAFSTSEGPYVGFNVFSGLRFRFSVLLISSE